MDGRKRWLAAILVVVIVGGGLALTSIRGAEDSLPGHNEPNSAAVMSSSSTSGQLVALTVNATPVFTDAFEHALDIELEVSPGVSMQRACDRVVAEFISDTLISQAIQARGLEITETLSAAVATSAVSTSNWMEQFAGSDFLDQRTEWLAHSGSGMTDYKEAVAEIAGTMAEMANLYNDVAKSIPTPTTAEIDTFLTTNVHLTGPSGRADIVEFTFSTEGEMHEAYETIALLLHDPTDERPVVDRLLDYAHSSGLVDTNDMFDIVEYQFTDAGDLPSHLASVVQAKGPGIDFGISHSGDPIVFVVLGIDYDAGLSEEDADTYAYESIMSEALIEAVDIMVANLAGSATISVMVDCSSHRQ